MRNLAAIEYVSLDGVMQAPGHAAEDPDGGFEHGGWTGAFMAEHRRYISASFQTVDAFLLGRITYEIFAAVWPAITDDNDQIAHRLNTRPKYVASTTLADPAWQGTRLLSADVAREVTELKAQPGKRIALIGSSQLAHYLMRHDLIDEYELYVHPVVLGRGKRVFPDDGPASNLRVADSRTTGSGLVILTYERMHLLG
jgi:dihydrofolate reductase